MRALGHLIIAGGATVSLYGLALLVFGDGRVLTLGVVLMVGGFLLPRVTRKR